MWLKSRMFNQDPRSLWRRYVLAVLFVAISVIYSHYAPKASLRVVEANAEIIDMSGRQRMLSQRILFLAALVSSDDYDVDTHKEILSATSEFEQAQSELSSIRNGLLKKQPDENYRNLNASLDRDVATFIALARSLEREDTPVNKRPKLDQMIEIGSQNLLSKLDAAVQRDEAKILAQVQYTKMLANIGFATAMIILLLEALFIFLPAHRIIIKFMDDRKIYEAKLIDKNAELEHFTYVAAHDLRSPLRGMENLTDWIAKDVEEETLDDTPSHIDLLRQRIFRMNTLLSDMLAYSKIGKKPIEITRFKTQDAIQEVVNWIEKPNKFIIELGLNFPIIEAPISTFQQVFLNLIGNSIKHHDQSEGLIQISYEQENKSHIFRVSDDGPGIDEQYTDYIFKPFNRLSPKDVVEGSGIGLSITRKLVASLGGKIILESQSQTESRGASFRIEFPIDFKPKI